MNTSLMRTYEDITFGKSEDVELKKKMLTLMGTVNGNNVALWF